MIFTAKCARFDDWWKKYGSETNQEATATLDSFQNMLSKVGFLVRKGMIDADDVYDMIRSAVVMFWERFEPINIGRRERLTIPTWMENFARAKGIV